MGHARLLRRLPDAARDFVHNNIVMGGIATDQTTEANDGIVFPGCGESASGRWNFECPGNADELDVFAGCSAAQQSVERTAKQPFRDELVKARDDNGKVLSGSAQIALNRLDLRLSGSLQRRIRFAVGLRESRLRGENRNVDP